MTDQAKPIPLLQAVDAQHCPRCGRPNACTANAECWCMSTDYQLSNKARAALTELPLDRQQCLCAICLHQLKESHAKS
ncbi:MAG: cysteine-rich CWC family protein [Xanthomonadales bacterium]|nr:cysteine-rich CWC family protein [Xanthomonadales bacterium]